MTETRDNHYVPQWYQKGFLSNPDSKLYYLDLTPDKITYPDGTPVVLRDGTAKTHKNINHWPTSKCFYKTDLYTTFFGQYINDDVERFLFGRIDDEGAVAVRALIDTDMRGWHDNFTNFFSFIDAQKFRTPKGLDWISHQYPQLSQIELMIEMQSIRNLHCAIWAEGVREIVSAENSNTKFLISDHPVTIYNYSCNPEHDLCKYPNDPSIQLKASQTLFPLDKNHCLILTNLEYAKSPDLSDPREKRTHSKFMRNSMVRTDKYIRSRKLAENEVSVINFIIKARAKRYIAAEQRDWLYPELAGDNAWESAKEILVPPENELHHFGGEIYVGYKDGSTRYQDEFGREDPENTYLKKEISRKIGRDSQCGCGSGRKFKKCCHGKKEEERPAWDVLSIRERNIILYRGVYDILGINEGKTWNDIRRQLSNEQIVDIYNLYWSLWPRETDLYRLLPRSDNRFRVIYTGVLDPRTIALPLATVPYFDEIVIQHPFVHPKSVNDKFSPLKNPQSHKYQTLKNILLFLILEPYVRSGEINFVPDPCVFDSFLHQEMMRLAAVRRGDQPINEAEKRRLLELGEDDFGRTIRSLSYEQLKLYVSQSSPELTQSEVERTVEYMKKLNERDPLAIIQENLCDDGGQLMINSMSPNFEMSLFLAQITGSAILTDSETRWDEIVRSQVSNGGEVYYPMKPWADIVSTHKFSLCLDQEINLDSSERSKHGSLRKVFREVFEFSRKNEKELSKMLLDRFVSDFVKATRSSQEAFRGQRDNMIKARFEFLIPQEGFSHNNVHRLLIKSGCIGRSKSVPLAIFIEPTES